MQTHDDAPLDRDDHTQFGYIKGKHNTLNSLDHTKHFSISIYQGR
jgi:hypothetical protein